MPIIMASLMLQKKAHVMSEFEKLSVQVNNDLVPAIPPTDYLIPMRMMNKRKITAKRFSETVKQQTL